MLEYLLIPQSHNAISLAQLVQLSGFSEFPRNKIPRFIYLEFHSQIPCLRFLKPVLLDSTRFCVFRLGGV